MIKMAKGPLPSLKDEPSPQLTSGLSEQSGRNRIDGRDSDANVNDPKEIPAEAPATPEAEGDQTGATKKARLKYNEASGEVVINLGDVVDWDVLTADARAILKSFDDSSKHSKPEDKQRILMSLCTLFGWPTSIIASTKSPTEDEVQAERSDVEAALDRFDSLDRPEISSSQHQVGEDDDEE